MPWRRERLPTPASWPGEFHGLLSKSMGPQRAGHDWVTVTIKLVLDNFVLPIIATSVMILLGIDTPLSFKVTFLSSSLAIAFLMWTTFQRCTLQFTLQRELPYFSISIEMAITTHLQKEILPGCIYYWHKLIKGKLAGDFGTNRQGFM